MPFNATWESRWIDAVMAVFGHFLGICDSSGSIKADRASVRFYAAVSPLPCVADLKQGPSDLVFVRYCHFMVGCVVCRSFISKADMK